MKDEKQVVFFFVVVVTNFHKPLSLETPLRTCGMDFVFY